MLLGNKEKTIKIHAENFLHGNLSIDYGMLDDERSSIASGSNELSLAFQKWLTADENNDKSDNHRKDTLNLYGKILGWRITGRLKGILVDIDLEDENAKLKDDNVRYRVRNEQLQKDNIILANEKIKLI